MNQIWLILAAVFIVLAFVGYFTFGGTWLLAGAALVCVIVHLMRKGGA